MLALEKAINKEYPMEKALEEERGLHDVMQFLIGLYLGETLRHNLAQNNIHAKWDEREEEELFDQSLIIPLKSNGFEETEVHIKPFVCVQRFSIENRSDGIYDFYQEVCRLVAN